MTADVVRAAGGLVVRRVTDAVEVLLVHRDRYDDWSFPKGKLDPGETWQQAAVREVFEETGVVPVLGHELPSTSYHDRYGRPKLVRYWQMSIAVEIGFESNTEITLVRWVPVEQAASLLSYERDHPLLAHVDVAPLRPPPRDHER